MFSEFGWVDTLMPLIVPGLFGNIMMIFFLRQYLTSVPGAIIEAAKIDGASYFGIFSKIVFPLNPPSGSRAAYSMVHGNLERLFGADHLFEFAGEANASARYCELQCDLCDSNGLSVNYGSIRSLRCCQCLLFSSYSKSKLLNQLPFQVLKDDQIALETKGDESLCKHHNGCCSAAGRLFVGGGGSLQSKLNIHMRLLAIQCLIRITS